MSGGGVDGALPTVSEAQAGPAVAQVYADIRETMGVALVNLIWRHLATVPPAFDWAWEQLKPLYASGAVPAAAWRLRRTIALPTIRSFTSGELAALGLDAAAVRVIDAVLHTYERGNAQNLVALCALRRTLEGESESGSGGATDAAPAEGAHLAPDAAGERADRVGEAIPPLPGLPELPPAVRAEVEALAAIGAPARGSGIVPSAYRHLACWPALLPLLRRRLESMDTGGRTLGDYQRAAIEAARAVTPPRPSRALEGADAAWLLAAVETFIETLIGRMVVIVPVVRAAMPREPDDSRGGHDR